MPICSLSSQNDINALIKFLSLSVLCSPTCLLPGVRVLLTVLFRINEEQTQHLERKKIKEIVKKCSKFIPQRNNDEFYVRCVFAMDD